MGRYHKNTVQSLLHKGTHIGDALKGRDLTLRPKIGVAEAAPASEGLRSATSERDSEPPKGASSRTSWLWVGLPSAKQRSLRMPRPSAAQLRSGARTSLSLRLWRDRIRAPVIGLGGDQSP